MAVLPHPLRTSVQAQLDNALSKKQRWVSPSAKSPRSGAEGASQTEPSLLSTPETMDILTSQPTALETAPSLFYLCAAKEKSIGRNRKKNIQTIPVPSVLAFQPSWSLIFLGRRWQHKEAWKNHRQLKTESTNMPKSGKHKLPRGLLGKQEHFNMASTLSCEISIRNHFGIWEITFFLILCYLMKARGQGVITLWQMSCIFQYFILQRKTRKRNDAQATSGTPNWDGQKGNQITDLPSAPSQNQIPWQRLRLLSCHNMRETTLGLSMSW